MRRARVPLLIALCCVVWWACTEAGDPTAAGHAVSVGIVPRFQIDPALFATSPIERVLLQARDAATRVVVGVTDRSVDPAATQWSLSLGIDLGGQETRIVIVEAELFSGSAVVWSGRLGPFTVPSAAPALALDIYPGPLDNLDVLSLNVLGAPSQLVAGSSVTLTAELTLVTGSDAAPVVQWASTNPTVATVTPAGSAVTLTAVTAGTANIVASVGSQDYQFALQVLPPGSASKTWVGGASSAARAWSEPTNWSPTGAPTATDDVLIPATANEPLLSSAAQVNDLTVSSGATLDLGDFSIQVTGDLHVLGAVTFGTVVAGGTGGLLDGTLDGLYISQSRSVTGSLTLTGALEIAAPLTVGAQTVSVGGSMTVLTGGRLVMTTGGSIVNVAGDAIFAGDSEDGFLTAGLLIVGGNFTAAGSTPTAFVGSGTHSVGFGGSALQTIAFEQPGPTASRFNTVFIDNGDAVDVASDVYAVGNVLVSSTLIVPSPLNFDIGGSLRLDSGSILDVNGSVTAVGGCINLGGTITGAGTNPCVGAGRTFVGGASGDTNNWQNPNNWSPVGVPGPGDTVFVVGASYNPVMTADAAVASITVSGTSGVLMGGYTLTVSGDVDATGGQFVNGTVVITGPGTVLEGSVPNLQIQADRGLSGYLDVANSLTVTDADLDLNGQTVTVGLDFVLTGANAHLVMTSDGFMSVDNDVTFDGGDEDGLLTGGQISVGRNMTVTNRTATGFVSSNTHQVIFDGTGTQQITLATPGLVEQRFNSIQISNTQRVGFASNAFATGNVDVIGWLGVDGASTVEVLGTLTLYSGSVLDVDGVLTASTCTNLGATIQGGGSQPCGALSPGVTKTWLGGASPAPYDWSNADNWSPAAVPTANDTVLVQGSTYSPVLSGNATVAALTMGNPNSLTLSGFTLTVTGDLDGGSYGIYGGVIDLTGPGTVRGFVDYLEVRAPRQVTGTLNVASDLSLYDMLDLNANTMSVSGDLIVQGAGNLVMIQPADYVIVYGDATFDGADHAGSLTEGTLLVAGNLTVTASTPTAFASTDNHVVQFNPGLSQTVSFAQPGATQQRLNNATIFSYYGTTFTTDAYATGNVTVNGKMVVPAGVTVTIAGTLTLNPSSTLQIDAGGAVVATNCSADPGALLFGGGTFPCTLSPVSADRVWIGGTTGVEYAWDEPANWSPTGVPQSSESVLIPPTPYPTQLSTPKSVGSLRVWSGASLDLGGSTVTVTTDLQVQGGITNGLVQVTDVGTFLEGNLDNLRIDAPRTLSGQTILNGSADVFQQLTIGNEGLYVYGNLTTSGAGEVSMTGASGILNVSGTTTFGGLSTDLTDGIFYVGGDLDISSAWSAGALVYLIGNADQTVSLSSPGVGEQWFQDLYVATNGLVTFNGDIFVTGIFYAYLGSMTGTGVLEAQGTFYASDVTFVGLPVRIDTTVLPSTHLISGVTFTGYAATDTQLFIRMPGEANPLTLTDMVFSTVPPPDGTTGHYLWAENSVVGGTALTIELNNPTPLGVKSPEYLQGTNTIINWP